jgi:succinoglycan biosynthesis transport protein ExoP
MELREYFRLLLRRWPVLVLTMVVGAGIAYVATDRTPRYEASALILVSPERFMLETEGANVSFDRIAVIDRLLLSYSAMIKSSTISTAAAAQLDVDRSPKSVIGAVSADVVTGTQLLSVSATAEDPAAARDIANAVADAFVDAVDTTSSTGDGRIPGGVPVSVFERAGFPAEPLSTGLLANLVLGSLFGLLVGAGACIAVDAFDVTARSVEDAERRLGIPVLGAIPDLGNPRELVRDRIPDRGSSGGPDGDPGPASAGADGPRRAERVVNA